MNLHPMPKSYSFHYTRLHTPSFRQSSCICRKYPNYSFLCPNPANSVNCLATGLWVRFFPALSSILWILYQNLTFRALHGSSGSAGSGHQAPGLPSSLLTRCIGRLTSAQWKICIYRKTIGIKQMVSKFEHVHKYFFWGGDKFDAQALPFTIFRFY